MLKYHHEFGVKYRILSPFQCTAIVDQNIFSDEDIHIIYLVSFLLGRNGTHGIEITRSDNLTLVQDGI